MERGFCCDGAGELAQRPDCGAHSAWDRRVNRYPCEHALYPKKLRRERAGSTDRHLHVWDQVRAGNRGADCNLPCLRLRMEMDVRLERRPLLPLAGSMVSLCQE